MDVKDCKDICKKCMDVLETNWSKLRENYDGVLNVQIGTKVSEGKDTGEPSITVYVAKKKSMAMLAPSQVLPKEINGVKVDVVELSTGDYQLGDTGVSKLSPEQQLRMASGLKCKE